MIIRTTSHRSREKLIRMLNRHPQFYYTMKDSGKFVKMEDSAEIEKALAIKGITKCRDQDETKYLTCWRM